MKILHLNTYDIFGGAAKGMNILHQALVKEGIDSQVLVQKKETLDENVISISSLNSISTRRNFDNLPLQFYSRKQKSLMSCAIIDSSEVIDQINALNPDIVHLHWVCHAFLSIEDIAKINRPIVWTLRDVWPFTGGCHLPLNCDRYKVGCGQCPILESSDLEDITFQQIQRKTKAFQKANITLVGISPWITKEAASSKLGHLCKEVIYINNNYDSVNFYPSKHNTARKSLHINTNKHIIAIGANSFHSHHKGMKYFIEMLAYLDTEKFFLLFFGEEIEDIHEIIGFEYKSFGYISDVQKLREIYTISSVFVAPSIHEPFGKTIVESMACGTPVVCFENSGGPDMIINHKKDGYKAKMFDSQDLASGVKWLIENYSSIATSAQKRASQFSSEKIANEYINLYRRKIGISKFDHIKMTKTNFYDNLLKAKDIELLIKKLQNNHYKKIVIYGYGTLGQTIHYHLGKKILGFIDKDKSKIDNKLIFHPEDLNKLKYEKIIISVLNRKNDIITYLQSIEVPKKKIVYLD